MRQFIHRSECGVVGIGVVVVVVDVVVMTSFCLQFIVGLFFLEQLPSVANVYVLKISSSPASSKPFAFASHVNLILALNRVTPILKLS